MQLALYPATRSFSSFSEQGLALASFIHISSHACMHKKEREMTYPIVPCLDCPDYGYCRRTESFLSCDKYLNWRKERGYPKL